MEEHSSYSFRYRYLYNKKHEKVITQCLVFDKNTRKGISYGFALRSKEDTFQKDLGRKIARLRALEAIEKQSNIHPINYWGSRTREVLNSVYEAGKQQKTKYLPQVFTHLGIYKPE